MIKKACLLTAGIMVSSAVFAAAPDAAALRIDQPISSSGVIQRNYPVPISGSAQAGEKITLSLANQQATTTADKDGQWSLVLPALSAGGPYILKITGTDDRSLAFNDILVGDILLCSGQSNMEYGVRNVMNGWNEVRQATEPNIRLLKVPKDPQVTPQKRFKTPVLWQRVNAETIGNFSAVCYFTAKKLSKQHDIPYGLIDASWGGSKIEAWIAQASYKGDAATKDSRDILSAYLQDKPAGVKAFDQRWQHWWQDKAGTPLASVLDGDNWKAVPNWGDWKAWSDDATKSHLGQLLYQHNFTLTPKQAAQAAWIELGGIDEVDTSWINGKALGSTFGWGDKRRYHVPAGQLKAGANQLVVAVLNSWGQGGMLGPIDAMRIVFDDESSLPIGKDWTYQPVPASYGYPPRAPWEPIAGLSGLYNGMISPLTSMPISGMIWYQGESNVGNSRSRYANLLARLFGGWRTQFGGEVPAYIIQLPNFGRPNSNPVESNWSELRESQRLAAKAIKDTALIVTIDAGENADIHPPNKQIVAARTATAIRQLAYQETAISTGPRPVKVTKAGKTAAVVLELESHALQTYSSDNAIGFELCTGVQACRFVTPQIKGKQVHFTGAKESDKFIRYCWGDAPLCNLFDQTGTPLVPFEMKIPMENAD